MRREDILNSVWSDCDFADLSPGAKLVYIWSFTNPRCNMAGLYKVTRQAMAADTGFPSRRVEGALSELQAANFIRYQDGVLWVRARIKHLRTRSPSIATSVANDLEEHHPHPLVGTALDFYGNDPWLQDAIRRVTTIRTPEPILGGSS